MPPGPPLTLDISVPAGVIAKYAQEAGFSGEDLVTAVAVALAEHSGDVHSARVSDTGDYGVWQINWQAHQSLFADHEWSSVAENAKMAYAIWSTSGWRAWTTWRAGEHQAYVEQARNAAANPGLPTNVGETTQEASWFRDSKDALGNIANAIKAIAQKVWEAAGWMANPHNWVRAALVGLGGSLVIGALVIIAKPAITPVAQAATSAAKVVK